MTEPMDQLQAWRNEIATELEEARQQLIAALEAQIVADEERRSALAREEAWRLTLAPLKTLKTPIAHALAQRLSAIHDGLRKADGKLSQAKAGVENARYAVEDLTQAIAEIDRVAVKPETMAPAEDLA